MRWFVAIVCMLVAAPVAAQSTYVGASVIGDLSVFSKVSVDDDALSRLIPDSSIDSEALAFGVSAGRRLGSRWGVEVEFVRTSEVEQTQTRALDALTFPRLPTFTPLPPGTTLPTIPLPFPLPDIEVESEQRRATFGAMAWARQEIGDAVELSFLGGMLFARTETERSIRITDPRLVQLVPIPETTSIDYQVAPSVGVDAIVKFGDHTAVVGGLRVSALSTDGRDGWLIRPSAGVRWRF